MKHALQNKMCLGQVTTNRLFFNVFSRNREQALVLQYRDAAAGGGEAGAGGTKTCLDTHTDLASRRAHARTQRKHKHETRFPGWRCHKGLTPQPPMNNYC